MRIAFSAAAFSLILAPAAASACEAREVAIVHGALPTDSGFASPRRAR